MKKDEGRSGPRTSKQRRLEIVRRATTDSSSRYSIGGREKRTKKITMPKVGFIDDEGDGE